MDRYHVRVKALHLLLLISFSQFPASSAHPFSLPTIPNGPEINRQEQRAHHHPPQIQNLPKIEAAVFHETPATEQWPAWQQSHWGPPTGHPFSGLNTIPWAWSTSQDVLTTSTVPAVASPSSDSAVSTPNTAALSSSANVEASASFIINSTIIQITATTSTVGSSTSQEVTTSEVVSTAPTMESTTSQTQTEAESTLSSSSSSADSSAMSSSDSIVMTSLATSASSLNDTRPPSSSNSRTTVTSATSQGGTETITNTFTVDSSTTETIETTTIVTRTSVPNVSLTSLTTSAVQTVSTPLHLSNTVGSVHTSLETSGNPSKNPFPTSIINATSSLSIVDTSTLSSVQPTAAATVTSISVNNIFQTIATNPPPAQISQRGDHPVPRLGIQPQQERLQTNKFYANFFLGSQSQPSWTHPYSVAWSKGAGESSSWGLSISHTERSQLATGPKLSFDAGEWGYFVNPVGIQSLLLSAVELNDGTTLTTDTLEAFSVNVNLIPGGGQSPIVTFPLLQGMGFVTGKYNSGTPLIQSGIGITNLTYAGAIISGTTYKYRAMLQDGSTWLLYVSPQSTTYSPNSFDLLSPGSIQGASGFNGYIQIAKVPANTSDAESVYDSSAGAYPTGATITGSVQGTAGSYSLSWTKAGVLSQPLLMFALPHHIESFSSATSAGVTDVQLVTTTKGMGTAVRANSWTLDEPELPVTMSFAPWTPEQGDIQTVSAAAVEAINAAGNIELQQNISAQTNVGSLYYDGKALAKFATIIYTLHDIAGNRTLALSGLQVLQTAFALHVNNEMDFPLVYDTAWGGAVSIASYLPGGNSGDDFGNTYYNDHHFHYGYFVYTAAVIGYLNPGWLNEGTNKDWVNMLVRDYANSIPNDPYFPFTRMFDWYHGHSWAAGVIESGDGKNQESSSEDTMASYGLKMWGQIIDDQNMEARGNLMLAIQQRSLSNYYLYLDNNTVEPSDFIGNKAAGILFDNKIDHTTYFGTNPEYIEGIHMLPLMPFSKLTRSAAFVQQEWDTYFAADAIDPAGNVPGGWRGILMANLALIDPVASFDFFSNASGDFTFDLLDGGASQTWYLAWSAALGGSGAASKDRRAVNDTVSEGTDADRLQHGYIGLRSTTKG